MAFLELVGVASVGPFIKFASSLSTVHESSLYLEFSRFVPGLTAVEFVAVLGFISLSLLLLSTIVSVFTSYKLSVYSQKVGADLSSRLFRYYILRGVVRHNENNSAILMSNIIQECARLRDLVIQPFMNLLARASVAIVIILALIIYDPLVALVGSGFFIFAYFIVYKYIHTFLVNSGVQVSKMNGNLLKRMSESFGAYRELYILRKKAYSIEKFDFLAYRLGDIRGMLNVIGQVPRFFMELVAFGSVITLTIYLTWKGDATSESVVTILAVYALAGFKVLPALQHVYGNLTQIRSNLSAFDVIRHDLEKSLECPVLDVIREQEESRKPSKLQKSFGVDSVTFTYPGNSTPSLKSISLVISAGQSVGIVGPSGSGKSTLMDIMLGLVEPDEGSLVADGELVTEKTLRDWYNKIGFVPQGIYLTDVSIRENIALGVDLDEIDDTQVRAVLASAQLLDFVCGLKDGIHTVVGERGVNLSGGQRQRIALARALYTEPSVLFLDEATSALDGITEHTLMSTLNELAGEKTVVLVAHRLSTVKNCDVIYYLDQGKIVDTGTYSDLYERNASFQKMASGH